MNNFEKGAEWRKWDLHIHTPNSICQEYGGIAKWDDFIKSLEELPENIKVIGITDYYFIDGYEKVMEYKNKGKLKNIDKIFPILEFRIDTFGSGNENKLQKINLHILFDVNEDDLTNEIKKIKEEFIEQIKISSLEKHQTKKLSIANLTEGGNDNLKSGFDSLIPPTKEVFKLICSDVWKEKTVIFAGYKEWSNLDKNQQLKPIKEDLYERVSLFLSSNKETIEKSQNWLNEFGNKKLLHSGDIHNFDDLTKKYCCNTWIKADTTFKGLLQAINEPEDRIYIGDEPPVLKRVKNNSTKYISTLELDAVPNYNDEYGIWFKNQNIPINNELVAIIGNKGNGKSAIADILGLCGSSDIEEDDYKFLHKDKFKKGNIAKKYQAKIDWEDRSTQNFINLDSKINKGTIPKVKYLTQGYFERLCNEISKADNFRKELEKVVFQHINDSEKLGTNSFEEFIDKKKPQINNEKELLFKELAVVNSNIIKLEEKLSEDYKRKIESELETKKTELEAHIKNEPKKIGKPEGNLTEDQEEQKKQLEKLKNEISVVTKKIIETEESEKQLNMEIFELDDLIKSIEIKEKELLIFKENNKEKLGKYDIDVNDIIKVDINVVTVNKAKNDRQTKLEEIKKLLSVESESSLLLKKEKLLESINLISNKLSEPEKLYQEYIKELEKWTNRKNEIEGKEDTYGTLKYYEKELNYIENSIKDDLEKIKNERMIIVIEIFGKIKELQKNYNTIKYSIDKVLSENIKELESYPIKIESTIKIKNDFVEDFLKYISLTVAGSFRGKEDGELKIKEIISEKDFNNENEIKEFLDSIIYNLENDTRGSETKNNNISKQIKNKEEFYSFLFSLEYMEPYYELMQNNKSIEQLSPGEKGALLLVFYLLLDKSDIPLIIDQPEDNLDNQSVSRILVPFIKKAKERRQIIMVTHNPNLAVVADAEQIIYVHIDKENKNAFSFVAGSIENEQINKKIVEVLEGTMPAFTNRKNKYHCTE